MRAYNREIVAERLKLLRESKGWTITEMGRQLNKLLGYEGESALGLMSLSGNTGKHTVSQLESLTKTDSNKSKRNISPDIAFAYAEIFDVTLDYIYGYSDDWIPDFRDIKDKVALTDKAIKKLEDLEASRYATDEVMRTEKREGTFIRIKVADTEINLNVRYPQYGEVLSAIIEDKDFAEMIKLLNEYCECKQKRTPRNLSAEEKWGVEGYLDAHHMLTMHNEVGISREKYALISLQEAADLFKTISKRMRPIPILTEGIPTVIANN